jgi:hypothetical protein
MALDKLDLAVKYIKAKIYQAGEFDEAMFEQGEDIIMEGLIQRFEIENKLDDLLFPNRIDLSL